MSEASLIVATPGNGMAQLFDQADKLFTEWGLGFDDEYVGHRGRTRPAGYWFREPIIFAGLPGIIGSR
jgi:hypothetical protein